MIERKIAQKHFAPREVRFSIAMIILWSLLVTAFFTYIATKLSENVGQSAISFVLLIVGYIVIVIVLTMHFSHRFLGPFQRLKTEMRLIMTGDYNRRLNVRNKDDMYIKSFIIEANKMLDVLEKTHLCRKDILEHIDSGFSGIITLVEAEGTSREKLRDALLSFHGKIKSLEQKHSAVK
jgi:uncharacterized membrane protein